jgi:LmbE family N-acetylglucosaminyl deacetylase
MPISVPLMFALAAVPQPGPTLAVTQDTRVLVVAPHPDDEVLAAGGLMQRVRRAGGTVRVVYLTDGDGYKEGVKLEDTDNKVSSKDYLGYGRRRQHEARSALKVLGIESSAATFLSFPDHGLCRLTRTYWSDRRRPYRSPYTRRDRPPHADTFAGDMEYRGEDLTQELAQIIGEYRPTLILVPRKEDQHEDHCAAWFFVADALSDVSRVHKDYAPDLVNYIVHFNDWPFRYNVAPLDPPPGLRGGASGWIRFPLTPAEVQAKRSALYRYKTQVRAMGWFLDGFARSNELFSRPAPSRVVLPTRSSPCCER